jgi:hypothetical protein
MSRSKPTLGFCGECAIQTTYADYNGLSKYHYISSPSLGPLLALLVAPLGFSRSRVSATMLPRPTLSRASFTFHPTTGRTGQQVNRVEAPVTNIGDVSFLHTSGSVQIIRARDHDGDDAAAADVIPQFADVRDLTQSRAAWHDREILIPTSDRNSIDDPNCRQRDVVRHALAWWLALFCVMLCGCILSFANYSTLLSL